jgi:Protein of unknown function (DUF4242)
MTKPRLGDPNRGGSAFLVERYVPPSAADSLARAIPLAARLCTLGAESGPAHRVQYLLSAYLPAEDTCFCVFRAATADAVRALNHEADLPVDRITAAILLYPTSPLSDLAESRHT